MQQCLKKNSFTEPTLHDVQAIQITNYKVLFCIIVSTLDRLQFWRPADVLDPFAQNDCHVNQRAAVLRKANVQKVFCKSDLNREKNSFWIRIATVFIRKATDLQATQWFPNKDLHGEKRFAKGDLHADVRFAPITKQQICIDLQRKKMRFTKVTTVSVRA